MRRLRNTNPALTGGGGEILTLETSELMAREGLWPRPEGFEGGQH